MRVSKTLSITAALIGMSLMSGCGIVRNQAVAGSCYLDVTQPLGEASINNVGASKKGVSEAKSILGWVGTGDASIAAAAKSAGITKIAYVDYHSTQVLGVVGTYQTIVYGE